MKRFLTIMLAALMLVSVFAFTGCGKDKPDDDKEPQDTSAPGENVTDKPDADAEKTIFKINGADYALALPENTQITYSDGQLSIKIIDDVKSIDLTPLSVMPDFRYLEISCNEQTAKPENLILPAPVEQVAISLGEVGRLDASKAMNMKLLSLECPVKEAEFAGKLENAVINADLQLSIFKDCSALNHMAIYKSIDLAPLADLPALADLTLCKAPDDGSWDLSPVAGLKNLTTLRLFNGGEFMAEELKALEGASFTTLQVSDNNVRDLSVLKQLPACKILTLEVSCDQNGDFSPAEALSADSLKELKTHIPVEQLQSFIDNGGAIYAVPDQNRIFDDVR